MTRRVVIAAGLLMLACAALGPPPAPLALPARVAVEILPGLTDPPEPPPVGPERVEILLDLTTSMRATTAAGPARFVAARQAAVRLLEALPEDVRLGMRGLGLAGGASCVEATPIWTPASRTDSRATLISYLRSLQPTSEGSLAAALWELQRDAAKDLTRTRVVLLTDLGTECGGDLCAAGSALVAAGARLELVLLSDVELPECFLRFAPDGPPRLAAPVGAPPTPAFRAESYSVASERPGVPLAAGRADGRPVAVPAGAAMLRVEMTPPSVIGPMLLSPDTLTRVRIVDFPTLDPHVREWRWDVVPAADEDPRDGAP